MDSPKPYSPTSTFDTLLVDDGPRPKRDAAAPLKLRFARLGRRVWGRREWTEAGLAAVEDLIALDWLSAVAWLFVLLWLSGLLVLLVGIGRDPNRLPSSGTACQPDGSFGVYEDRFSVWQLSGFFQTTMAWGTLSFANAKLIDVAWDVVFGRGGQALIAWISWSVFSDYVTTSIQVSPITYETFWSFFLREQPGASSTWYMVRDFSRYHGLRSRSVMVFMVLVTVFVLIFPTFSGAMTGYSANTGAFVKGRDGELIKFSDFDLVLYIIHDGWRVGLSGDFPVTINRYGNGEQRIRYNSYEGYMPTFSYGSYCASGPTYYKEDVKEWEKETPMNERCTLHNNLTEYVEKYGFFGLEDKNSTFMNQSIPAPTLNIEPIYIPDGLKDEYYGRNWTDPRTNKQIETLGDADSITWVSVPGNQTYGLDYVLANGTCQPMTEGGSGRETYQWGFSFIQLYIMMILLALWTVGVALLRLKARLTMRMRGRCDAPRGFKGVLELAAHIRKELAETDPDGLSRGQLDEEIRKRLRGGSIGLESAGSPAMYGLWGGFWAWCKERRWTALAFVVFGVPAAVLICFGALSGWLFGWYLFAWSCSVLIAMVVGRSAGSRLVLTLACGILGTILFVAIWRTEAQREDYGPDLFGGGR